MSGKRKSPKLTPKQESFCLVCLESGNASEAYRWVYRADRMKSETVNREAKALLDNPKIATRLAELRGKAADRAVIDAARVLTETARVAFADVRKLFDKEGEPIPVHLLDEATAAALAGVDVTITVDQAGTVKTTRKYRFTDKNSALERLFRHLGLFLTDNEQRNEAISEFLAWLKERSGGNSRLPIADS
jgi:phage terminase small subunit